MANADFIIYTLGDTATFEAMLQGVALIFQDPIYSGDAAFGLGYGVFLGVLILFTIALYQSAFKQKFDLKMLLIPFIFYVMLTLPKTTVTIVDSYNQETPRQVANIPLGLALPLNLISSISQSFTESMETAYSTPNSPRLLVDGFVSPLRTLYALRYVNISEESPFVSNMINQVYQSCIVGNPKFDPDEYRNSPDSYTYFMNFLYDNAAGIVTLRQMDGSFKSYSCFEAASELQKSFESFVFGDGVNQGTLNYNFKRALNGALLMTDGSGTLTKTRDYSDIMSSFSQITDLGINDGRQFLLNALFNQPLQSASLCTNNNGSTSGELSNAAHCIAWVQGEAQLAEDNAAAATGFLKMMQDGQNILLILAILMFPMVVLMIVYMGTKSVIIISSYLMYLASVYLWMPLASIINFYSYIKIKNTIYTFTGSESGDLFAISDYPAFYQSISDSLAFANTLIAILPIFSMMFFSGMTMAMVSLMRRMDVTKSPYYDSKVNAPSALGSSPFSTKSSMTTTNGLGATTDTNGGKAFTMTTAQSFETSASQMVALQKKKAQLESKSENLTAQISSLSGVATSGGTTENRLSDVNDTSRKDIVSGQGFTQNYEEGNSGQYIKNSKSVQLKSDEHDVVTAANQMGVNTGAGIGLKIGKGTTFANTNLAADGTPSALQDASTEMAPAKGGGDNTYGLGPIQVKAGSAILQQSGYRDGDRSVIAGTENNALYKGSGKDSKEYAESDYAITGGFNQNQTLNGQSHNLDESINHSSSESRKEAQAYKASLTQSLSETNAELEQVNRAIASISSSSLSVSMLDSDIMHRITRHESVRNDLERIDREYGEKYGEKWEQAKNSAAAQARGTTLAVSHIANPEQLAYYTIVMAGMSISYDTANVTFKALTGYDAPSHDLNENLRSANTDWSNLTVNNNDLKEKFDKYFGSFTSLEEQYAYLAGELQVHGDTQQRNMIMVYNSFLHAGFSPKQAAIMTAEVGRENSFDSPSLYGTHYDPEKKHLINGGMISFNQDRKIALDSEMMAKGLVAKGKIGTASYVEGQASLDAMAQFMYKELSTQKRYATAWKALNDESKSVDDIHYAIGKNYIVWRIDDVNYRENGDKNRKDFASKIEKELISQSKTKNLGSDLGSIPTAGLNNPSLIKALAGTGLKGQILGDGLVDNKYIARAGLPIKAPKNNPDQAYGGGKSRGYTVEFAHLVNDKLANRVKYFSGFNDEYHQNVGSKGKHVQGKAFDLILSNPNDARNAIAEMQKIAKQHGYKVAFVNEYESKSKDFTGKHLHVSVLGREGGYQNKVAQELEARQKTAATALEKADATRTQVATQVKTSVGTFIPTGRGKDRKGPDLDAIHAKNIEENTKGFNQKTLAKTGVTVTPDKNGEDLHFKVEDKAKLAQNLHAPIVKVDEVTTALIDNVKNAIERNKTMPADLHLDREMGKAKEDAPQYSDYNINRQKHKQESTKDNDAKLQEATGLHRHELVKDRREIEAENEKTREVLNDALIQKRTEEMDRRFNVIKEELEQNPVERTPNAPATRNSALVGNGHSPDPSQAMLTADNLSIAEAVKLYNAKREAKDKE